MTSVELAQQQLAQQQVWAAWVSAIAALVQATGAVLAIFFTIRLARESAQREIASEKAAVEREQAAERAATARAEAAERAASERSSEAEINEHNRPIEVVLSVAALAMKDLDEAVAKRRAEYAGHAGTIIGTYDSEPLRFLRSELERLSRDVVDPALVIGMDTLKRATVVTQARPLTGDLYIADLDHFREALAAALSEFSRLKR